MVGVANGVWAVVGLFFWVPLLVRAVLLSAVRIVHGAVTRQPPTYLRAFIASETRFYLAGFWTRKRLKQVGSQRKYHLKLRRLVGEVLWAGAFYLGLLRLVDRERFLSLWRPALDLATGGWEKLAGLARTSVSWIPEQLPRLIESGYPEWIIAGLIVLVVLFGGVAFGLGLQLRRDRRNEWFSRDL
jgi:hypothetical protein